MEPEAAEISQMLHLHTAPIAYSGSLPDVCMVGQPSWIATKHKKPPGRLTAPKPMLGRFEWRDMAALPSYPQP